MRTQRVNTSVTTLSRPKSYRVEFSEFVARRSSEFAKLALIATCVSGIFVSGCAKSASQKLTEDAGKAALDAEKELAAQREREALIAQEEQKTSEEVRVVLSSAEKSVDSPLAEMLREEKPRDRASLAQDTQVEEQAARDSASAWDKLIAEHLAEQSVTPEKAPNSPEAAVDQLAASSSTLTARPFPGAMPQTTEAPVSTTDSLMAWANDQSKPTAQVSPKPEAINPHKLRVQALLSEAHSQEIRGELKAAYRSALLAQTIADQNGVKFDASDEQPQQFVSAISKRLWGGQSIADAKPTPEPKQPAKPFEQPRIQPQHRHVAAHQDLRSSFQEHDEAASSFPGWTGSGAPTISPRRTDSSLDSVFAQAHGPTQWTAVQANEPATLEGPSDQEASLKHHSMLSSPTSAPAFTPEQAEESEPRQPKELKAPSFQQWQSTEVSKPPLVAHADEVTPAEAEQAENPFVQHAVVHQELELIQPEPSPLPERQEGIRALPQVDLANSSNEESIVVWSDAESELATAQSNPGRTATRWGVIGFIAAIIAGAIGVKLSRNSSEDENEPSPISLAKAAPEEPESDAKDDDDNGHHLKISRAA